MTCKALYCALRNSPNESLHDKTSEAVRTFGPARNGSACGLRGWRRCLRTRALAAATLGDGRLAELVEWARASQNAPAMGVVIIRGGQVAERAVVGKRSMNGGPAATVDDRWHLGSITKSMTSTLAATMVEDGLI